MKIFKTYLILSLIVNNIENLRDDVLGGIDTPSCPICFSLNTSLKHLPVNTKEYKETLKELTDHIKSDHPEFNNHNNNNSSEQGDDNSGNQPGDQSDNKPNFNPDCKACKGTGKYKIWICTQDKYGNEICEEEIRDCPVCNKK